MQTIFTVVSHIPHCIVIEARGRGIGKGRIGIKPHIIGNRSRAYTRRRQPVAIECVFITPDIVNAVTSNQIQDIAVLVVIQPTAINSVFCNSARPSH